MTKVCWTVLHSVSGALAKALRCHETAIREYFTRERRQASLKWPKLTIEAAGHSFIFYEAHKRRPPEEAKQLMEQGFAVACRAHG